MNQEYARLAYECTVIMALRRHLIATYLDADTEALVCEELPYSLRHVPQDTVIDVVRRLEEEERVLQEEMSTYEFRKQEAKPLAKARAVESTKPKSAARASSNAGTPNRPARKGRAKKP